MPPFPKPDFPFEYSVDKESASPRAYRDTEPGRTIPRANIPGRLMLATWNVANLGAQERREDDYKLVAEVLSWFDLIALQEVNDNLEGLRGIQRHLPASSRVTLLDKVGEVAVPPNEISHVRLPGIE